MHGEADPSPLSLSFRKHSASSSTPSSISPTTTDLGNPDTREISHTTTESSLSLPGLSGGFEGGQPSASSRGAPLQSKDLEKLSEPKVFPGISSDPRLLIVDGQVDIRGLLLQFGVLVTVVEDEAAGEAVGVMKLPLRCPHDSDACSFFILASIFGVLFKLGLRFKFKLR